LVHSTWITELHSHFVLMKIHTKFIYLVSEALMVCDTTMMIYTQKMQLFAEFFIAWQISGQKGKERSVETAVPLSSLSFVQ